MLSDNEFKLLANEKSIKDNKSGINKRPYNGDGYTSIEDRKEGYKALRKYGFIHFEDSALDKPYVQPQDITMLVKDE